MGRYESSIDVIIQVSARKKISIFPKMLNCSFNCINILYIAINISCTGKVCLLQLKFPFSPCKYCVYRSVQIQTRSETSHLTDLPLSPVPLTLTFCRHCRVKYTSILPPTWHCLSHFHKVIQDQRISTYKYTGSHTLTHAQPIPFIKEEGVIDSDTRGSN